MSPLPPLSIDTQALVAHVEELLAEAAKHKDEMGAVNWGDLGVRDIEYRLSLLHPENGPFCIVAVEEASPDAKLAEWLSENLDDTCFPEVWIQCEW